MGEYGRYDYVRIAMIFNKKKDEEFKEMWDTHKIRSAGFFPPANPVGAGDVRLMMEAINEYEKESTKTDKAVRRDSGSQNSSAEETTAP